MPFSDQLDAFQLPPELKLQQLELYDGIGDPRDTPLSYREQTRRRHPWGRLKGVLAPLQPKEGGELYGKPPCAYSIDGH
ncbi:hypothetical protein LIER_20199 [Lithospermum erythrorhizon]|uniref:Uncharacterized protein n=1 Tax=Lithospermum erythrorhizon TaxID=34254 RepID=A0AAV3QKN5_LITER